jgi:DNA polymerase III delta prime subunit
MPKKTREQSEGETPRTSGKEITEQEMDAIIARARQTMKKRISKDAASEIVSNDLLNFRIKAVRSKSCPGRKVKVEILVDARAS